MLGRQKKKIVNFVNDEPWNTSNYHSKKRAYNMNRSIESDWFLSCFSFRWNYLPSYLQSCYSGLFPYLQPIGFLISMRRARLPVRTLRTTVISWTNVQLPAMSMMKFASSRNVGLLGAVIPENMYRKEKNVKRISRLCDWWTVQYKR